LKIGEARLELIKLIDSEVYIILKYILFGKDGKRKLALAYLRGEISGSQRELRNLDILRKMNEKQR